MGKELDVILGLVDMRYYKLTKGQIRIMKQDNCPLHGPCRDCFLESDVCTGAPSLRKWIEEQEKYTVRKRHR